MSGRRWRGVLASFLDPLTYFQVVRLLHYYSYTHVRPRRLVTMGEGATLAPNVSLRNGERIAIGARSKIGERAYLWAGDASGRVTIGEDCRLGPEVFVAAGVTIGDGCVVSAGSVVSKSLPPGSVAVGIPARIVRRREDYAAKEEESRQ